MSRTPLLLLPGWGMPSSVWKPLLPELEHSFELLFLDWCGIDDLPGFQRHVLSVINRNSLERFSLMGWSLGSLAALQVAAMYPSLVENLILFGATSQFVLDEEASQPAGWPKRIVERMKRQLPKDRTQTLNAFYRSMFSDEEKLKGLDQIFINRMHEDQPYSDDELVAGLDYLTEASAKKDLNMIQSRVLLIHGEADQICPPEASRIIAGGVTGPVHLEVLANTGHIPFFTQPRQCLSVIKEVVKL
ncbi:alpha/beta fold hydrolase [Effusibacillus consociatus]|uniref:Alpha/beta fold hydrolase n=1 Tax=Effusibacillus consociatus TaxID=1117041 RepID=A0ABV9Q4U1_9BACL